MTERNAPEPEAPDPERHALFRVLLRVFGLWSGSGVGGKLQVLRRHAVRDAMGSDVEKS